MTHTIACGKSKKKKCVCACGGKLHGELVVKEYTKKVKQFARMSDELYKKTFGDRV
jgi:hypothetical protein